MEAKEKKEKKSYVLWPLISSTPKFRIIPNSSYSAKFETAEISDIVSF